MIDNEIVVAGAVTIVFLIAIDFLATGYGEMLGRVLASMALCGVTAFSVHKTKSAWCLWALCLLLAIW